MSYDFTSETVDSISAFLPKLADTEGQTSHKQRSKNKKRARDEGITEHEQAKFDARCN